MRIPGEVVLLKKLLNVANNEIKLQVPVNKNMLTGACFSLIANFINIFWLKYSFT